MRATVNSIIISSSRTYISIVFYVLLLTFLYSAEIYSQNLSKESNNSVFTDSSSTKISDNRFLKLQSDLVFTDEYDTGFGIGGGMGRALFHPRTRLISVVNFWGASSDSVDVFSLGIDENITYRIPVGRRLSGIAGLTFGLYYNFKKTNIFRNNKIEMDERRNYLFEKFITFGVEYEFTNGRTFLLHCKYGTTGISKEFHIQLGLYIHRKYMIKSSDENDL